MNKRNVQALQGILGVFYSPSGASEAASYGDLPAFEAFARFLASRGVLVPSALSDEEIGHLVNLWPRSPLRADAVDSANLVAELERIAKGGRD
jgi:hypothetical protein